MAKSKYKEYTDEFKKRLLEEIEECGSATIISKKYDVPPTTISSWKKKKNEKEAEEKSPGTKELKKKISDLELENKILKELLKKTNRLWLKE